MRGRSHRFQSVDPHDDWVDGSWTVDCVCGVTFDDGEEMVNCDECGVWVHTRCSKYVKGEELFACDKCKNKNNRNNSYNDSEETEVARLLVELPTKTVRLETSYNGQARRPVRLWTEIPMENRVHVQGIPGGEPGLFNGLSSVFTPELWKCSGYVPKKFNFQYKEFPCWDEKEGADKMREENDTENENPVNKGVDALFSLSKDSVLATSVAGLAKMRGRDEEGGFEKVYSKETKKWEGEGDDVRRSQNDMTRDRTLLRPVVIHSGKRQKEDLVTSRDRSGKKKAIASEKEADERKKRFLASRSVFRPTSDAKPLEFYEDRGPKYSKPDIQNMKNKNLPGDEDLHRGSVPDGHLSVDNGVEKPKNELATNEHPLGTFSSDASRPNFSNVDGLQQEMAGHQVPAAIKSSPTTDDVSGSMLEHNDARSITVKQEGENMAVDKLSNGMEDSAKSVGKAPAEDMAIVGLEVLDNQILKDSSGDMSRDSVLPNVEVKTEVDNEKPRCNLNVQPSPSDLKKQTKPYDDMAKISKVNDVVASSLQSSNHKAQDAKRTSEAVTDCHTAKFHEVTGVHCQKRELEEPGGPVVVQKSCLKLKHSEGTSLNSPAVNSPAVNSPAVNSPALTSQHKMLACVGKSSSSTSITVVYQSSAAENLKSADAQNSKPNTKQRLTSDNNASSKKDHEASGARDEEKHDVSRKTERDHSKSSLNSISKVSHSSRISHATILKRTISDAEDSVPFSSSKSSLVQSVAVASGSGESARSLQSQCALRAQNKTATSTLLLKGEKSNESNFQPPPKVNNAPLTHSPAVSNSPATLSDEELALLLHQELNSSPRVPRVPRVRHTGSLPQLSSPAATSMLIKRTSSSGGKDHNLVSRRKNKDASRDGFRSSREVVDEASKMDRVSSSPDLRRQDLGYAGDTYTRREDNGSLTAVHSVKRNMPSASTMTTNSGPASSTEVNDHNVSSVCNSPRNISDDDTGTNRGPVHRTLPGLINEIMSKGQRMTYEELCNAVLPYWPHLRKHNGERYAYSSHSQAVLDCLRNRHEWARLVDRGPKTNSSRKRRKRDSDDESEDNEYVNGGTARELENKSLESQREEFPKGKRKARKRRRLALQGRGTKDVRRRRKVDLPSDDDIDVLSNSNESMFSEDENHGSEDSASGDDSV